MDGMFSSLLDDWSPVAVLAKLGWIVQLAFIVHALKTGRPYFWVWILFVAPVIGGIAYAIFELAPDLDSTGGSVSWKPRAWRIRDLQAQLDETDTVKLRLALADELLGGGHADEACQVVEDSLTGVWRDDPHTLAAVGRYQLEAGKIDAALQTLGKIDTRADRLLEQQVAILRGRALVEAGRHAEGQAVLRAAMNVFLGEEGRYFLAVSLAETDGLDDARETWTDIRKRYRRANRGWRRSEKRWFILSGEKLRETKA